MVRPTVLILAIVLLFPRDLPAQVWAASTACPPPPCGPPSIPVWSGGPPASVPLVSANYGSYAPLPSVGSLPPQWAAPGHCTGYRPVVPARYYVGRNLLGSPTMFRRSEPIRNVFRYLLP